MLSRMEGRKINSIENLSELKYTGGRNLEATLDRRSALEFCNIGIVAISYAIKWVVSSCVKDW